MKKIICATLFCGLCTMSMNAQAPIIWDLNAGLPFYFGGKGGMLGDIMAGMTVVKMKNENIGVCTGFSFSHQLIPGKYNGTADAQKMDFGSFNASMPSSIPVNYEYSQSGIGMQFAFDLRYYIREYNESGLYAGLGLGFDYLSFKSTIDKYDDYNYYFDRTINPEAPYSNDPTVGNHHYGAGSVNVRATLGYSIVLSERKQLFFQCVAGAGFSGKKDDVPVSYIYSRAFLFYPSTGYRFIISSKKSNSHTTAS